MQLRDSFYFVRELEKKSEGFYCQLYFAETHPIFEAHFPENPVVPGVLHLEILRELVESIYGKCGLLQIKQTKFLLPVKPGFTLEIHVEQRMGNANSIFKAQAINGENIFWKAEIQFQN